MLRSTFTGVRVPIRSKGLVASVLRVSGVDRPRTKLVCTTDSSCVPILAC
jgi:hypothetical protein